MEVCGSCGAVALPRVPKCGVCGGQHSERRRVDPLPEGLVIVGVRCRFQCRGCGKLSTLDGLDLDGEVRCSRCGLDQVFDVGSWGPALSFAHGVGDLAGPTPEGGASDPHFAIGDRNPFQNVGSTTIWATHTVSGEVTRGAMILQRSLEIRAHPGRPLCSCGAPLSVRATSSGAELRCASCGASNAVARPPELHGIAPTVVACFEGATSGDADDADAGGAQASTQTSGPGLTGSLGFTCPGCGAPLPVIAGARLVTCAFCKLSSPIAVALGPTGPSRAPAPERAASVWWVVFRGPSSERRQLLREDGPGSGDPSAVPEPRAAAPTGLRWALRLAATWGFPAVALGIAGVILVAGALLWVRLR